MHRVSGGKHQQGLQAAEAQRVFENMGSTDKGMLNESADLGFLLTSEPDARCPASRAGHRRIRVTSPYSPSGRIPGRDCPGPRKPALQRVAQAWQRPCQASL